MVAPTQDAQRAVSGVIALMRATRASEIRYTCKKTNEAGETGLVRGWVVSSSNKDGAVVNPQLAAATPSTGDEAGGAEQRKRRRGRHDSH